MVPNWPVIDLWSAELSDNADIDHLLQMLSDSEREQASRFVRVVHKDRFVQRRAFRRIVLGHYLNCAPEKLRFCEDGKTKPRLSDPPNITPVHFNSSHSQEAWVLAVSTVEIGIDIEYPRKISGLDALIERTCSTTEKESLARLSDESRNQYFFTLWTAKEAVAKLTGEGLRAPLDAIDTGGNAPPYTATYQGRRIHLLVPAVWPGAFTVLATFGQGASLRQRKLSSLCSVRSRSGGTDRQGTA